MSPMVAMEDKHTDRRPEWQRSEDDEDEDEDDGESDCDNEEEEDDDEDDDGASTSFVSELRESWQQHTFAIIIAIIAALLAHRYTHDLAPPSIKQQQPYPATVEGRGKRKYPAPTLSDPTSPASAPAAVFALEKKHTHLLEYQRVANLTFCNRMEPFHGLEILDFHLPKKHIPTLAMHLASDVLQDDDYSTVLDPNFNIDAALEENLMYQCLLTQSSITPKSFIKGLAYYYPTPKFESMYPHHEAKAAVSVKQSAPKISPTQLTFTGFSVKCVNLSPEPILFFWDGPKQKLIGEIAPYESLGTAAIKAGQSFSVTPVHDKGHYMARWVATADDPVYYFQPEGVQHNHGKMSIQLLNREYARHYLIATGRQWLAQFPRPLPVHEMWSATHFGQKQHVQIRKKTYKLEVVSVTPRVFSIEGFLSDEECDSLIALANAEGLKPSSLQAGRSMEETTDRSTRSSSNAWLARGAANVTDQIYQRAAHLLKMDEDLLQKPVGDDYHPHEHSLAESLQVVRYKEQEEYQAHHDFVFPPAFNRHQPTRFATLLMYLNDDFEGGQTVFPRAVNAQYHDGITVQPKKGKAVLFYNMLPDGNMDDLSQHASKPIESGTKFLANLWVWDPHIF